MSNLVNENQKPIVLLPLDRYTVGIDELIGFNEFYDDDDENNNFNEKDSIINESCYMSIELIEKLSLKLGDWIFIDIQKKQQKQCIIAKVWTSRYIQQNYYIQSNSKLILNQQPINEEQEQEQEKKKKKKFIEYPSFVKIYKVNEFENNLNQVDIEININTSSLNNNNNNNNNIIIIINNIKTLFNSKQYIKQLLINKLVCSGMNISLYNDNVNLIIKNVNSNNNNNNNNLKIGLINQSTKINIIINESLSSSSSSSSSSFSTKSLNNNNYKKLFKKFKLNNEKENNFKIGGLNEQIKLLEEMIIYPILFPDIFKTLGIDPPKGILLKGPPGTGKTHLVRTVCDAYDIEMISIDCTKISGSYIGETEENLRNVFQQASDKSIAKSNSPVVVFIDEIDTICPPRSKSSQNESRIVGQFLTLLDGIGGRKGNLIIIAATNRPNQVDPALRRPGRLDREIEIPVPNKQQRLDILRLYCSKLPISSTPSNLLDQIADETVGYVGANIQFLCRDSAFIAFSKYNSNLNNNDNNDNDNDKVKKYFIEIEDFRESIKNNPASILKGEHLVEKVSGISWDDIGGLDDIKEQLKQAIEWPNLYKESFEKFGLSPPKGIILYGPPGCSKTTLVKAIASSSKLSFLSLSGATIFSPYLGDSEQTIRDIFKKARQTTPSILFFDEIDAIVSKRNLSDGSNGDNAQSRVLSTFLNEMDGVEQLNGVIVIGATNRLDMIDNALLRPGRFDKILEIKLPDQSSRLKILKIKTKSIPLLENVDLVEISNLTNGFSGADLENLCREASFQSLRRDLLNGFVEMSDFLNCLSKIHK
ncbi:hypothetical protein RB653_006273 [Dictyostelium firmibasis]|uniref:AAA+ ATPase domain-containing protein n=1 Tax=Dictyostelium firmibasis TaxID=79012 RepID=A0AAN7U9G2_9MYCE